LRPEALMDAVQEAIVDEPDAGVLSEAGNSFAWATHRLRFRRARQYRVSSGFGSMGHACAGVVGAAIATRRRCAAIVGDGSLLMQNELTSALAAAAPATWIVLNDAQNDMVKSSYDVLGLAGVDVSMPRVDFRACAAAQGVDAVRVEHEHRLGPALRWAADRQGPSLVEVMMQPGRAAPVRVE
jgi:acetolactate synthase-1/2/3 large subunit